MNRMLPAALAAVLLAPAAHAAAPASSAREADTLARIVTLGPVEVSTTRVADRAGIAHSTLGRAELQRQGWGQDIPMLLGTLPGAYAYSDAGNGIGYSYLSVRGFPQRRISVLVNGVPLNDPETHEVWWIDHPDLLAGAREVQLQRGTGSALYGAASLGGSVDIETGVPEGEPGFHSTVTMGSYGTRRVVLEGAGQQQGWSVYGRYSRIQTDGYRDQSWSRLWSFALSARHADERQAWTVNVYGGPENTHLAYVGIPYANEGDHLVTLGGTSRTYNPITWAGEQDHFVEPHYELVHTRVLPLGARLTQTFFYFDGNGWYDEQRGAQALADYRLAPWATSDTTQFDRSWYAQDGAGNLVRDAQGRAIVTTADLVRHREVTNRHFGWVPRVAVPLAGWDVTAGGELRFHDGHHVGTVLSGTGLPPGTVSGAPYYDVHPRTLSSGVFARAGRDLPRDLHLTADLAWRHQAYDVRDDRYGGTSFRQHYDFVLPRLALAWSPREALQATAALSYASREPALRDLYDGEGVGAIALLRAGRPLVHPEHVLDAELGATWKPAGWAFTANLYRMDFRDELVSAGQYDVDLNYPITGNAARSIHQGAELSATRRQALGAVTATVVADASLADNHFVRYTEHWGATPADELTYDGKAIGFFPATMAHAGAHARWGAISAGADARWTGRIYVDNSETAAYSIPPRTVLDVDCGVSHAVAGHAVEATLRVLNAADARYATGGWVDVDPRDPNHWVPWLTPAATRNWLASVRVGW